LIGSDVVWYYIKSKFRQIARRSCLVKSFACNADSELTLHQRSISSFGRSILANRNVDSTPLLPALLLRGGGGGVSEGEKEEKEEQGGVIAKTLSAEQRTVGDYSTT